MSLITNALDKLDDRQGSGRFDAALGSSIALTSVTGGHETGKKRRWTFYCIPIALFFTNGVLLDPLLLGYIGGCGRAACQLFGMENPHEQHVNALGYRVP